MLGLPYVDMSSGFKKQHFFCRCWISERRRAERDRLAEAWAAASATERFATREAVLENGLARASATREVLVRVGAAEEPRKDRQPWGYRESFAPRAICMFPLFILTLHDFTSPIKTL